MAASMGRLVGVSAWDDAGVCVQTIYWSSQESVVGEESVR